MLYSMTGFGKATCQLPSKKITVEIKSLNSKQFDLSSRVPSAYRETEISWRHDLVSRLQRGKIDLSISIENFGDDGFAQLNTKALQIYKNQIQKASETLGIDNPADWYSILLRFPDTMLSDKDTEISPEEIETVHATVLKAAEELMDYRRTESLTELLSRIPRFEAERIVRIKDRLAESLSKIPAFEYDKGRLEQEMIFYIEKLDVTEERQRLTQHLKYFSETLELPEPGQGKKLGFIAQEMGREINTLGSKSNHAEMQRIVVMMKDELEQIKEQVLNVM